MASEWQGYRKLRHTPTQNVSEFSGSTSVLMGSSYLTTTSAGGFDGSVRFNNLELRESTRGNKMQNNDEAKREKQGREWSSYIGSEKINKKCMR